MSKIMNLCDIYYSVLKKKTREKLGSLAFEPQS
ncbi:hypothetical protein VCRA2120O249_70063 [Vibrio crassostreae]|nr:hypothetical protein VCRA2120O249_70063 [Vibrio crassostreae]